jgi:hypothetical protein
MEHRSAKSAIERPVTAIDNGFDRTLTCSRAAGEWTVAIDSVGVSQERPLCWRFPSLLVGRFKRQRAAGVRPG